MKARSISAGVAGGADSLQVSGCGFEASAVWTHDGRHRALPCTHCGGETKGRLRVILNGRKKISPVCHEHSSAAIGRATLVPLGEALRAITGVLTGGRR